MRKQSTRIEGRRFQKIVKIVLFPIFNRLQFVARLTDLRAIFSMYIFVGFLIGLHITCIRHIHNTHSIRYNKINEKVNM